MTLVNSDPSIVMTFAKELYLSIRSRMNLLNMETQTFVVPANIEILLKIESVRHLKEFVLGLDTCSTKDDRIYHRSFMSENCIDGLTSVSCCKMC